MKRILACFLILIILSPLYAQNSGAKTYKVVIDAGHGGHDPGTRGKVAKEKDVALAVALKLGEYIDQNMQDVEVIYTRKTDVFIELFRRAQIANENHADLFISIHCNGVKSKNPMGTETWVMGLHKSDANLEVAKKENAVVLLEDDYSQQYDGFDPNSPEANIIFSFFQNAHLNQSLEMASLVQNQFRERVQRVDRGVKQAGFLVLYRTTMPGILVETGFLTNPDEEAYLNSDEGQSYIASAIYRALREYRSLMVRREKDVQSQSILQNIEPKTANVNIENDAPPVPSAEIEFGVQIKSSPIRLRNDDPDFLGLKDVKEYLHAGSYKYYIGGCKTYASAISIQQSLVSRGFIDAFIIAMKADKRIAVEKAREEVGE